MRYAMVMNVMLSGLVSVLGLGFLGLGSEAWGQGRVAWGGQEGPRPCDAPIHLCQAVGDRLMVDGVALHSLPGVVFAPVVFGEAASPDAIAEPGVYLPLLDHAVDLGARVLRVPNLGPTPQGFLCAAAERGLMVVGGFWLDSSADYTDPVFRNQMLSEFGNFVLGVRSSPGLILYELGNELNHEFLAQGRLLEQLPSALNLIDQMGQLAGVLDANHPVTTVFGEVGAIGVDLYDSKDADLPHIAAYGVNVFRGASFRGMFDQLDPMAVPLKTQKPIWVAEFGLDTWDRRRGVEDQLRASGALATFWGEVLEADRASFVTVLELSQSAWKSGSLSTVSPGGWQHMCSAFHSDDEYYALVQGDPGHPGAAVRTAVFDELQRLWTQTPPAGSATPAVGTIRLPLPGSLVGSDDYLVANVTTPAVHSGAAIFSVVRIPSGQMWAQAFPQAHQSTQSAVTVDTFFGGPAGGSFDVLLVLAPDAAVRDALRGSAGVFSLPVGSIVLDTVSGLSKRCP